MEQLNFNIRKQNDTIENSFENFMIFNKTKNLSKHSLLYYERCYKMFDRFFDTKLSCLTINQQVVENFILYLRKYNPNMGDITVNTYLRGLRGIIYYFIKQGLTPKFHIYLAKADKPIKEVYTDVELKILLQKPDIKKCIFSEYRNWVIINYVMGTGNRLSSITNIKIEDIDFDDATIKIVKTKNRKQQIIPLTNTLVGILMEYLSHRGGSKSDYLFCNLYGNKITELSLQKSIFDYNRKRGVVKTSMHLFRHTFAKKWIMNGRRYV
jgi:integrase/recombinase XerD